MAGPIRISILADAQAATSNVRTFSTEVEGATRRVRESGEEMGSGLDRAGEAADGAEGKAQGFADTLTGTTDLMAGAGAIAKGDLYGGLLLVGTGAADLAGGLASFVIPTLSSMTKGMLSSAAGTVKATVASGAHKVATAASAVATGVWTGAQWLLNAALTANPIGIVIVAIVALVAIIVIAWKRSETFRRIVTGAFRAVLGAIRGAWQWVRRNWPQIRSALTAPVRLAVAWIRQRFDSIVTKVRSVRDRIKNAFSGANTLLRDAGRRTVEGLWNGITGLAGWLASKVRGFIESTVPGPIRRALGIASPSRVARWMGRMTGRGMGLGLEDETSRVRRAAAGLAAASIAAPVGSGSSLSGGGAVGGTLTLVIEADDSDTSRFLVAMMQKHVRVKGRGNVQLAFGTR